MSGGLDSTLVASLLVELGVNQVPLYVDYGQRNKEAELAACRASCVRLRIPEPQIADLRGYGALLPSSLTSPEMDILRQAFLPGRNALLLLVAAALAHRIDADSVAIGLLTESSSLFPDQTNGFIEQARLFVSTSLGRSIAIRAPLMDMSKRDVVRIARERGISATYSCHVGGPVPCGSCIACREYIGTEV
jgi:7-cyano-7-deazaguanine synthase